MTGRLGQGAGPAADLSRAAPIQGRWRQAQRGLVAQKPRPQRLERFRVGAESPWQLIALALLALLPFLPCASAPSLLLHCLAPVLVLCHFFSRDSIL